MSKIRMTKELREFDSIMKSAGYNNVRRRGSHFVYRNPKTGGTVVANQHLNRMIKQRLEKEIGVAA